MKINLGHPPPFHFTHLKTFCPIRENGIIFKIYKALCTYFRKNHCNVPLSPSFSPPSLQNPITLVNVLQNRGSIDFQAYFICFTMFL